ncbi:carnitine O-acetyltransferase, putative [Babesia ovata]|uniref:Carnitine O-acetyltransferase, putative n=1 Tax=Babesia ovata TaxID=189622 RepID=A0A2H6KEE2_9APIC|nr:carnitine O-acetyltransferase, putative [Babesia ovata]GBE61344.1 carnitine O-acetyltransferase, putative [Babesia ovata]
MCTVRLFPRGSLEVAYVVEGDGESLFAEPDLRVRLGHSLDIDNCADGHIKFFVVPCDLADHLTLGGALRHHRLQICSRDHHRQSAYVQYRYLSVHFGDNALLTEVRVVTLNNAHLQPGDHPGTTCM